MKRTFTLLFSFVVINSFAQTFTSGNLALLVATNGTSSNTGFKIVEINTSSANQAGVNTYAVDSTGSNALRISGSDIGCGYLSNSNDGTLLCFAGHHTTVTTGNINTVVSRGVGTFNQAGLYQVPTAYTGYSGSLAAGASTVDNATWYIGDQSGLFVRNSTTSTALANLLSIKAYGGNTYAFQKNVGIVPLSIITQSGGVYSLTAQPGLLPNPNASEQDFALVSSGNNGSYNILYILSTSGVTSGAIAKYSWVSGSWVSNGTYTGVFGGVALAALVNASGTGANLYLVAGNGNAANRVVRLRDIAGYNANINVTTGDSVLLYSAVAPAMIKGVAFAPKSSAALPVSLTSFNASLMNGTVQLGWNTTNEVNAAGFEVERSSDATAFTSLGKVAANNSASHYTYTDQQPLTGIAYYRLKMVDKDGSFQYSSTVSINNLITAATHLSVYPNPVTSTFTLTHAKAVSGAMVRIVTIDGRTLYSQVIAAGATQSTVDAGRFIKGTYFVVFENNGDRQITQFVK